MYNSCLSVKEELTVIFLTDISDGQNKLSHLVAFINWNWVHLIFMLIIQGMLSFRMDHWYWKTTFVSCVDRTCRPRCQLTSGAGSAVTLQARLRWRWPSLGWCRLLSSITEISGGSAIWITLWIFSLVTQNTNIKKFSENPGLSKISSDMPEFWLE